MEDKTLKRLYYDPKTGFTGKSKLKQRAPNIPNEKIEEFLDSQKLYNTHKKTKTEFQKYIPQVLNAHFQVDLVDFTNLSSFNKNFSWALFAIDIFSRFIYAEPLKSKSKNDVVIGMKKILERIPSKLPKIQIIQHDNGDEFNNPSFRNLLSSYEIYDYNNPPYSPNMDGFIERFNGTFKNMLFKYFLKEKTLNWIDVLDDFIENYNTSQNRELPDNLSPQQIYEAGVNLKNIQDFFFQKSENERILNDEKFKIDDKVRIIIPKTIFDKGYKQVFDDKIYFIEEIKPGLKYHVWDTYRVRDDKEKVLRRTYKFNELSLIPQNENEEKPSGKNKWNTLSIDKIQKQILKAKKIRKEEGILGESASLNDYIEVVQKEAPKEYIGPITRNRNKAIQEQKKGIADRVKDRKK
jgi:transposase InsO family protein